MEKKEKKREGGRELTSFPNGKFNQFNIIYFSKMYIRKSILKHPFKYDRKSTYGINSRRIDLLHI